jgi:cytosine/adenosine deaminase-related metal-dependent hydrolase
MPQTTGGQSYLCDALQDAAGVALRPGVIEVADGRIVAVREPGTGAKRLPRIEGLVMPAMVNVHAHLDLTDMPPQPFGGDFIRWGEKVMAYRRAMRGREAQAVRRGVAMLTAAGVGWVGDIAGDDHAVHALAHSTINGVSYFECFGHGQRQDQGIELARTACERFASIRRDGWRFGLSPHAPYSAGPRLYDAVTRMHMPLTTHLAETRHEIEFVRDAAGAFADLLRRIGKWDDAIQPTGKHPVQYLAGALRAAPWTVAHCNYVDDDDITLLAQAGASVAYCPIASEYFNHRDHRYRDMLDAGVNVCLGTDSIVCQPRDEPQPLGIMPAMRRLYARDKASPDLLLKMATTHGLKALGFDPRDATLAPGAPAKLMHVPFDVDDATDPLTQALRSGYSVCSVDWSK